MKSAFVLAVVAAAAAAASSPALARGKGAGLIGSVTAPVAATVAGVKLNALNVNALNNVSVLSGNKTGVTAIVSKNGILGGLVGGLGHGCGCN